MHMEDEYQREYLVSIGERPWGHYKVLANEEDHKVKSVVVLPGKRLSLQRHTRREEHWCVYHGKALVILGERKIELLPGNSLDIPRNIVHRIENIGKCELHFIEVQTGEYFGEDDIERLDDDHGRV